jgi:hypothetical protein
LFTEPVTLQACTSTNVYSKRHATQSIVFSSIAHAVCMRQRLLI